MDLQKTPTDKITFPGTDVSYTTNRNPENNVRTREELRMGSIEQGVVFRLNNEEPKIGYGGSLKGAILETYDSAQIERIGYELSRNDRAKVLWNLALNGKQ